LSIRHTPSTNIAAGMMATAAFFRAADGHLGRTAACRRELPIFSKALSLSVHISSRSDCIWFRIIVSQAR
jgi:hypothetical protein